MSKLRPPFYYVFREGGNMPTVRHENIILAENEAARLAEANPGVVFFVCEPVKMARAPRPRAEILEIPQKF